MENKENAEIQDGESLEVSTTEATAIIASFFKVDEQEANKIASMTAEKGRCRLKRQGDRLSIEKRVPDIVENYGTEGFFSDIGTDIHSFKKDINDVLTATSKSNKRAFYEIARIDVAPFDKRTRTFGPKTPTLKLTNSVEREKEDEIRKLVHRSNS